MTSYHYLIIGGGAAGVSAAETIRRFDKTGTMAIVSDEPYLMYSRVMLSKPKFFLGQIPLDQIYLKNRNWYSDNQIDFLGGKKAVGLDSANKTLTLSDDSKIGYEKLLIATGVNVRKWPVTGADKKGVHYLRSLEDGLAIMEAIKTCKKAVTIGGGFISFEMADLLKMAGLETTMILRESYFWKPTLDQASGQMIEDALVKGGVKLIKNAEVSEVLGDKNVEGIVLKDGTRIACDLIMCGIGVVNPIEWLKDTGIETEHGILATEYLETSVPDVWVAGDIAEYRDLLLEENVQMGNWVNAHEQGRVAGLNMVGQKTPFKFVSFYTTQGFGTSIAFVGDVTPGPDRTAIPRGSPEIKSYARLIIAHDEIEGATMINRTGDMSTISKLIENNMKVTGKEAQLGDAGFDLKSLL